MANQWHFKVMELLSKWMFNVVPLFLQATSSELKLMTVSYQWLYLTSEDLLNSVIELESVIFIILSLPQQSAENFFLYILLLFSIQKAVYSKREDNSVIYSFANDFCLVSHLASVSESH